ncbi:DegT/DnrJ/EryC1/StrS family aminotransferase [Saccharopolyspora sp. NPDC049426]|uniref:DegT/DnrJ/EryC1/StrS family aminotransferase n=1 Tax=Saccharopolyspora sp. NPDC049426 TaxID=3155652 RepID=UPI00341432DA
MSPQLALNGATPVLNRPLPHLAWPPIKPATTAAVIAQLATTVSIPDRSGIIAELEDKLAAYFGVRHAVLTSSGTAALHSAYAALGLHDGHEVLAPAYTFHATASPLFHLRASPVLVDCDPLGNLDPDAAEAAITPRTRAIAVTHLWGVPAQIERLRALADRYGLALIEDASHAAGATVSGRKVGSFGDLAAISMNGPKPLSAGEGGIVLTNDDELYYRVLLHGQYNKRCRAEIPAEHPLHRYAVTGTGLKLRIHPLAAALAAEQLPRLDDYLAGRRTLAEKMRARLRGLAGLTVPEPPNDVAPSWYALAIQHHPEQCDGIPTHRVVEALQAEGVDVDQPGSTRPLSDHPLFNAPNPAFPNLPEGWPRYRPGQFPIADALHRHTLKLPVPHDDDALTEDYLTAFTKIWTHRHELKEDPTA